MPTIPLRTVRKGRSKGGAVSVRLTGTPSPRQQAFFDSRCKYTAYGGARGGGKSWALRRKLTLMAIRYGGIRMLILRRSYPELRENHLLPLLAELKGLARYTDSEKTFRFPNGSRISLGYCAVETDVLQYQGQEYDVIAIDEATQLTEYQFQTLKACLRGVNTFPKRMYLTCNPGGVGHSWFKRLFVDRQFRTGEVPEEYCFIPAKVYDNAPLLRADPSYVSQLESLPERLRMAWLEGRWDLFEGQFFPEFSRDLHVVLPHPLPAEGMGFAAMDYGFDMLAVLWLRLLPSGECTVVREYCRPNLTLSQAAEQVAELSRGEELSYLVASPDLWNRRQDAGISGVEIMERTPGLPPMLRADDRRIPGWRTVREYLKPDRDTGRPRLTVFSCCTELIRCVPSLLFDRHHPEDAAGEPHSITHAPEALRYALMSIRADPVGVAEWTRAPSDHGIEAFLYE